MKKGVLAGLATEFQGPIQKEKSAPLFKMIKNIKTLIAEK